MNIGQATTILTIARSQCRPTQPLEDHAEAARNLASAIITAGGGDSDLIDSAIRIAAAHCAEWDHLADGNAAGNAIAKATNVLATANA